jgi:farnesyl-diphosphate farnesyltransferase
MGLLSHFASAEEFVSLLQVKFFKTLPKVPKSDTNLHYCYEILSKTSRSFAIVIQELPSELRDPICVFYLVLRALDTVEDDMAYPKEKKLKLLEEFYTHLDNPNFVINDCGEPEKPYDIELCRNFDKVLSIYARLDKRYRAIIKDITRQMGKGMAEFINRETKTVKTVEDYNLYCHYVAGLVGVGLSESFIAYGETTHLMGDKGNDITLSNKMGLFLQKTNIIRDYHEDVILEKKSGRDLRVFWPEEIWKQYSANGQIDYFGDDIMAGVKCLNHLICDALTLIPDLINYMSLLKDPQVFNFCAIPQVMAIATLAEIYDNPQVFKRTVKIRKGMTCQLMLNSGNITRVKRIFHRFAKIIESKIDTSIATQDVKDKTREAIRVIKQKTESAVASEKRGVKVAVSFTAALALTCLYLFRKDISTILTRHNSRN